MPTDRDGVYLTHIADTVTEIRQEQGIIVEILSRMVATAETHTEMLSELLNAAKEEPGPSETADALKKLVEAVQENTATIATMAEQLIALPAEIGAEVGRAIGQEPKAASA